MIAPSIRTIFVSESCVYVCDVCVAITSHRNNTLPCDSKGMVVVISANWKNADEEVINYVRTIAALIMKRRDDLKDAWKLPVSHSKAQDIVTLADETTVVSDETATANANVDYPSLTDVAEVSITLCQVITHDSLSSHLEKLRRQEQKKGNEGSRNLDELSFASMGDVSFASIEDLSFSSSSFQ